MISEAAETHTAQARGCQPQLKKRRFSGLECFFGWFSGIFADLVKRCEARDLSRWPRSVRRA
jgi:hypothetical protein